VDIMLMRWDVWSDLIQLGMQEARKEIGVDFTVKSNVSSGDIQLHASASVFDMARRRIAGCDVCFTKEASTVVD